MPLPYTLTYPREETYWHSWALTRELGFHEGITAPDEAKDGQTWPLLALRPGREIEVSQSFVCIEPPANWEVVLQEGHEYIVTLQPGLTLPNWTYGTASHRKGPYNLPPLPVTMGTPGTFTYEGVRAQDRMTWLNTLWT